MSFYITLPSNSSLDYFPKNTLNNFTTKLHSALRLDGEYEVGLVELSYPQNWKYRRDGNIFFKEKTRTENYRIRFSNYESIEVLIQSMNIFFKSKSPPIPTNWSFNNINNTIIINITDQLSIEFVDGINEELGFKYDHITASGLKDPIQRFVAPKPFISSPVVNTIRCISSLYVYCNIINYQLVGNTYAPLLRTITVNENSNNYEKYIEQVFTAPHYIPLRVYNIESIEIDIRDDTGEKIQFESGKILVKLHFRPKNKY